MIYNITGKVK